MFGRQFPFPIGFQLDTADYQRVITQIDYMKKLLSKLEIARRIAQNNVKKQHERFKQAYDKKQKPITYSPGTFVWLYSPKMPKMVYRKKCFLK